MIEGGNSQIELFMDTVMKAQLKAQFSRKFFVDSQKVKAPAFVLGFLTLFLGLGVCLDASADGSCVKKRTRGGYTISRDCVYQGDPESSGRAVNIYLGGAEPMLDPSQVPPYASSEPNSVCYAAPNQPAYQQSYQSASQNSYQPALQQVAPGVYVQRAPQPVQHPAQYGRGYYPIAGQYPVAYASKNGYGQAYSVPQVFQQLGPQSFNVQNSPLLLSPSALAQAVPVYLVQNTNYGQFQTTPVAAPVQVAPVAAPVRAAPVAAPVRAAPVRAAPVRAAPVRAAPVRAQNQFRGEVNNNVEAAPAEAVVADEQAVTAEDAVTAADGDVAEEVF